MKKLLSIILGLTFLSGTMMLFGCSSQGTEGGEEATEVSDTASAEATGSADKKAILVVSFGTSYNETREKTIGAIEAKIAEAYPDYDQKRAFTSQIIINKLAERDNEEIDNVEQAMERLVSEGYGTVVIQPTHIMNGEEYDEMKAAIAPYEDKFVSIKYGTPMLSSTQDYEEAINAIVAETPQISEEKTAVVFMGHGTEHYANSAYAALAYRFKAMGYNNVFVGTVEGYPDLDRIKEELNEFQPDRVVLLPFMIVAGDHATNDMAGDEEDSWKTQLKKEGYEVETVLKGLGEYEGIQNMYVEHCGNAISEEE